ncbi:MAG TPA: hypothetical protein PKV73_01205 [Agriterribacter sp.]|nr:hypothetical protein [Agriterribacter sp.]
MTYLLMHYTPNWEPIVDITRPIHEEYCERHGYKLIIDEVPEYKIYNGLQKLRMLDYLDYGDTALVMDADALITNFKYRLQPFFAATNKDVLVADGLNMGVFLFRKSEQSMKFIKFISNEIRAAKFNCEQDAMEWAFGKDMEWAFVIEHPCFNSFLPEHYPDITEPREKISSAWEYGDFILHLPALEMEKRLSLMQEYSKKIMK